MTVNREIIEMLKILKEQSLKSHNDTAVLEVKIDSFNFVLDEAIKALEQEEKTGAWVPVDQEPHEVYECNACGWLLYDEDRTDFKYCPNCGARMVSE